MNLRSTVDRLDSKIGKYIIEEDRGTYLYDPYFGITRNRVNAEYCKGLIRLERKDEVVNKIVDFLIKAQNHDGSWNEIHPYYDEPSSLVTSIVGDALIEFYVRNNEKRIKKSVERATKYVLSCERAPGYFIKSRNFRQDHLNVDATCADFLSSYARHFSDREAKIAAGRAVKHIRDHQFENGVLPYRVGDQGENGFMKVPCIHYQGVTAYYLYKTLENLETEEQDWLKRAVDWLAEVQKREGRFDWSKSSLMFAYRLTGAYAFAYSSYAQRREDKYFDRSIRCLDILNEHIYDLVLRWEKSTTSDIFPSFVSVIKSSNRRNDSIVDFLHKTGYGYYREFSRRRFTQNPGDDKLFEKINDVLSLNSSTIEPSRNYPDLFMTTECFDCLSFSYVRSR